MSPRRPFALALSSALALALAGCVTPASDISTQSVDLAVGGPALPHFDLSDAHDHKAADQHRVSWNMELLGWDPIAPDTTQLGRYNHVVVKGDRAYVSTYALAAGAPPGLAIFDISANDPVLLSTVETPELTTIDVHVSEDGKYAVLAGHRENRAALPPEVANTCTGTPMLNLCAPYVPGGVIVVDVSDGASPTIVAQQRSVPSGAHTAKIHQYDDGYYVFIASYGFSYANRIASHVEIMELTDTPLGQELVPVEEFFASQMSGNDGTTSVFVHDMFIADHEPSGAKLMWVAYWDGGVVLADVTDPRNVRELANWGEFDAALYGNVHFARPVGMIGERHISFAAPEYGSAEHAGEAYVLDTTDPTAPQLLAKWVLPGDPVNDGNYRFSPHNFDPRGTQIVYAHYHGGVWVLDFALPEEPTVKAYVFPTVPEGEPAFEATEDAPNIWAAVWADDGTIYASDIGTGLYHYRMVSEEPGVAPYEAVLAASG